MVQKEMSGRRWSLLAFVATTFLSAFLLFQVQPLLAKHILPWFGGSPSVWTVCMLFFQIMLIGGYTYAHFLESYLSARRQAHLHIVILCIALVCLPIVPEAAWRPQQGQEPVQHILLLLLASVGMPYFALSTTGILFQAWFRRLHVGRSPYPLYALSNAGSLLALISYPLAVEVWWSTDEQGGYWAIGFTLFVILSGIVAIQLARQTGDAGSGPAGTATSRPQEVSKGTLHFFWLALPATATLLLLAITNHITQNVAVVPFLWVVPLSLYLLSFILCFESERWYRRPLWWSAMMILLSVVVYSLYPTVSLPLQSTLLIYNAFFFAACMVCHGELVKMRPQGSALTAFYLHIAVGGALGGLFVALIAPLLFSDYWEFHLSLLLLYFVAPMTLLPGSGVSLFSKQLRLWAAIFMVGGVLLGTMLYVNYRMSMLSHEESLRNFYGVLHVSAKQMESGARMRILTHGSIMHGAQFLDDDRHLQPTTYYAPQSGVGQVMEMSASRGKPRRIGIIGLGVGTLASYGHPGDSFRFYEINPEVVRLAQERFSYLSDSADEPQIVIGDARLQLESEDEQQFDILVVDAFSGDAIPVHLLTEEAFAIYNRHLSHNGVICLHISNQHLDLRPPVAAVAAALEFDAIEVRSEAEIEKGVEAAQWMIVSRDRSLLNALKSEHHPVETLAHHSITPWTDRRSNIFMLLK